MVITRKQALALLHQNMQNQNLRRHCYAVEAVMRSLARKFKAQPSYRAQGKNEKLKISEEDIDEDKWGIVGLLHDGDWEKTKDNPKRHTLQMVQWLKEKGETDPEIVSAILSHNFAHTGQNPPKNILEWSLYCCDELTGLIVAVALVKGKSLANVEVSSVLKKFPEKAFAKGVKREQIKVCEEKLGIQLKDFVDIALQAMQEIHEELGL